MAEEEEEEIVEIDYEEQYGVLSEENKKLKIDISSLQLSNRSLVNQNRDEKKKVMDCRLQIADLEGRLKTFDATKQELSDSQTQCERIRMSLETSEAKLADADRRADEANGLIKDRYEKKIEGLKESKAELDHKIESLQDDIKNMQLQMKQHLHEYEELGEKCATLEARIKEMAHSERRYGGMLGSRLIGPTLPPWIADEKKLEKDLQRLSKTDPATLRAKVMELESQVNELNQLLTYREDVILRIHEEISKKASRLEASDVERSGLNAQISILKRELATTREDLSRRGVGPIELESEIERVRSKRDREYQRRKRVESDADTLERENQELKQRIKRLEEAAAVVPPPKPIPQSDPSDRNRINELQSTVNQLRMDNEAKRSELFDLRSRFDLKSSQVDKMSAEFKANERKSGELTSQLDTTRIQLETTTKDLESVRCRAVRGGAEIERWHSDLVSLQTTNKFLSSQLNELRSKIIFKDRFIAQLTRQCEESLNQKAVVVTENPMVNGLSMTETFCPQCNGTLYLGEKENCTENDVISMLETKLRSTEGRCKQLLEDADRSRKLNEEDNNETESEITELQNSALICSQHAEQAQANAAKAYERVEKMTVQVVQLETCLSETRIQLVEARSEQRKFDQENQITSPPAKRTRRGTVVNNGKVNVKANQDCPSCLEMRKQIQELEYTVEESVTREASLVKETNELRDEIPQHNKIILELRSELNTVYKDRVNKVV